MALATYVGFVRAVMQGRDGLHRDVVLDIVGSSGGANPATYLTTGNVSFDVEPDDVDRVVAEIESGIEQVVQRPTPVFVRSLDHVRALVDRAPFDHAPHDTPHDRLVTMVRGVVDESFEIPIVSPRGDYHVFEVDGGEIFSITIDVGGRMQNPGGIIERIAGEPVTTRAWGTIRRIVDKLG